MGRETYVLSKWDYGKSWEKFPIEYNQIWGAGYNKVLCSSLNSSTSQKFIESVTPVDLVYTDPPWNTSLLKGFRTKAGLDSDRHQINPFLQHLVVLAKRLKAKTYYLEIGKQKLNYLKEVIEKTGATITDIWDATYYKKNLMYIIRYQYDNITPSPVDLTGMDDEDTPRIVIENEKPQTVFDFCTGRGLTGKSSYDVAKFYGIELNKRRLANLLEWYHKKGTAVWKMK